MKKLVPMYDERPIFDLFAAQTEFRIVEIALRIGLFESLREQKSHKAIGDALAIGDRAVRAIVSVLAAAGLAEISLGTIGLSEIAKEYFLRDSPFFKGELFHLIPDEEIEVLRKVHLQDGLSRPLTTQWLAGKTLDAEGQAKIMHAHTFAAASQFAHHRVFSSVRHMLDVAGGAGTISVALALHNPELNASVMDLPGLSAAARSLIQRYGVASRVHFVSGDMFRNAWGVGYDGVFFSNIFHDWEIQRCTTLVRSAFECLSAGGLIFVNEMLMDEDRSGPLGVALFSAMMLLTMEGRQFTFSELNALLKNSGFVEVQRIASFGYYSLVVARKA